MTSWATDLMGCYVRHPWVLQVSFARPVLGPNEQAAVEALARVLRQAGLPAAVARRVVNLLFYVVRGTAQTVAESRPAAAAGGASANPQGDPVPYLEREAMEAFTVGLTVLLDGIQAAMAKGRQ